MQGVGPWQVDQVAAPLDQLLEVMHKVLAIGAKLQEVDHRLRKRPANEAKVSSGFADVNDMAAARPADDARSAAPDAHCS